MVVATGPVCFLTRPLVSWPVNGCKLLAAPFPVTGSAFAAVLPPMVAVCPHRNLILVQAAGQNGRCDALSHPAGKAWREPPSGGNHEYCDGMTQDQLQELSWQEFFSDPTQWYDYRRSKETPRHPDFRHKKSKDALWLNNWHKPAWVDSKLALWDAGIWRPPVSGSVSMSVLGRSGRFGLYRGNLELRACSELCEGGQLNDAVDALNLLVQRGIHIPQNLFHLVLKRCIGLKDLVLGKRIHALILENGYEGNAFLGTHLINMYASHGRLEEAVRVFSKVTQPSAYNWASIIFAHARHGESRQAIGFYGQMLKTTVKPDCRIFVAVLKACASGRHLAAGKDVHAHIIASAGKPDIFVQNSLVDMYAKCGSLEDAREVFDSLPCRDVVTWNALIGGYAQQGMGQEALCLYGIMEHEGITQPSAVTFVSLLQACAAVGVAALHQGKQLHVQIEQLGVQADVVVGASLVNMYSKCGCLEDAQIVFDGLSQKDVVTWNAMIGGYAQLGMAEKALNLYSSMQEEYITEPDSITFACLLQAFANVGTAGVHAGRQLHAHIIERGVQHDLIVGNGLVNMYAKCGSLKDARRVFDTLAHKDVWTWNFMIAGYVEQGMDQEVASLYHRMQQEGITPPNAVTFVCLLQACANVAALPLGKQLHAQIEEAGWQADVAVGASLVNMYAKCGRLEDAHRVFDMLSQKNMVTWTALFAGYAQQGMGQKALTLYSSMPLEEVTSVDCVTVVCLLHACANVGEAALHQGKRLHAQIEEQGLEDGVVLGNSLVNMYAKCGSLGAARSVFDRLAQKDVVTWTAMIAGYAEEGMCQEALSLYSTMQHQGMTPNSVTFICLLQACACVGALHQGKQLHAQIEEQGLQADVVVGTSLVNMYAKCRCLENAQRVFDGLPQKDVVTWTAMISGYAQEEMGQEALNLYSSMQQEGKTPPNSVTFVCLLQACASVAALPLGKQLHAQIEEQGLQTHGIVGPGMVNMYAKCGSLEDAQQVFDSLPKKDIVAWNALISGYTRQGDCEIVFDLVDRMRQEKINPDGITLLSILTVCSHVGLVDKGRKYFEYMGTDSGITLTIEHYTCMIDLLGRAGHLDEALAMVETMPFQPNVALWLTLLSACRKWGDVEVGWHAFECAVRLDETYGAAYVLMSNIYAGAKMWEEAKEMQARRLKCEARKEPGRSWWVDMDGAVHSFTVWEGEHQPIHK